MTNEELIKIAYELGAHPYSVGAMVAALQKGIEIGKKAIDKEKIMRVGYNFDYSFEGMRNLYVLPQKKDTKEFITDDFRQRFAKSIANLIVSDWDNLVFDERCENQMGLSHSACMYIVRKKAMEK